MSKRPAGKSNAGSDQQDADSVYDFLYHDARRVASFLAQLEPDGHLQSTKRGYRDDKSSKDRSSTSGGLSIGIGKLGLEGDEEVSLSTGQTAERTYDPLWVNALALLDYLQQRDLLCRDIRDAGISQLVVASGMLKVFNLKLLGAVWDSPNVLQSIEVSRAAMTDEERQESATTMDLLQRMPHMVQAYFMTPEPDRTISWMILNDECMVVPPTEIMLKYNPWIDGEWTILGIKDAEPDGGAYLDTELRTLMAQGFDVASASRRTAPFALLAEMLAPLARQAMGRPALMFGITPILIFRQVRGAISQ